VRAYALTDNIPLFSAYANDQGYEHSFSEQIAGIIGAGDLLIAISASGQSPNILRAVDTARSAGAATIGITGFDGGRLKDMVDVCILVPSHNIRQVEDVHMALVHLIGSCLVSMG
jgi:D-sedoheptulose 7-phosphate isomerase